MGKDTIELHVGKRLREDLEAMRESWMRRQVPREEGETAEAAPNYEQLARGAIQFVGWLARHQPELLSWEARSRPDMQDRKPMERCAAVLLSWAAKGFQAVQAVQAHAARAAQQDGLIVGPDGRPAGDGGGGLIVPG